MDKNDFGMTEERVKLALNVNDKEESQVRTLLKTHRGENLNKCNQCKYESSQAGHLRRHLKTHSGEKLNKCNQCDYSFSQASNLRRHTVEKSQTIVSSVTLHP